MIEEKLNNLSQHVFSACRMFTEEWEPNEPIIVFADNLEDAKKMAREYFQGACVNVGSLSPTECEGIFRI